MWRKVLLTLLALLHASFSPGSSHLPATDVDSCRTHLVCEEMTDFDGYSAEMPVDDHLVSTARSMKTAYEVFMGRSCGGHGARAGPSGVRSRSRITR
ncbi:hypothetical protein [Streptomyces sp. NPDC001833]|uniref:hypothetical protein n=1 Tax=Streptomyces sp. NPDC001833 TaxID=3154658 RepID=UPI003333130E